MHTHAIQLALHFQSPETADARTEMFLSDLRKLADSHGISLDDTQSMTLRAEDYRIRPCDSCSHLTVNRDDVKPGIENMLPDFWFYVRRGRVDDAAAICQSCELASSAT